MLNNLSEAALEAALREDAGPATSAFRRDPAVASKSGLDRLAESPEKYLHWCMAEDKDTPAMRFGRAFHCYLLEPKVFEASYAVAPDFGDLRTKIAKENKAAWLADHALHEMVNADDMETIRAMAESILRHPIAKNLVRSGQAERKLEWVDKETGLRCRGREDFWIPELATCVDVKTAANASPGAFSREMASFRYHVQDAFYRRAHAAMGDPIEHFFFVAVEKTAPYAVGVYYCDDAALDRAETIIRRDMDTLKRCVETGTWPGYTETLTQLSLPAYAFYD